MTKKFPNGKTAIIVSSQTKTQLQKLGNMEDSFDSVIVSLLDHTNKCDTFWRDKF